MKKQLHPLLFAAVACALAVPAQAARYDTAAAAKPQQQQDHVAKNGGGKSKHKAPKKGGAA